MASVKALGSIPSANAFLDDPIKYKKKKAKKQKKEKLDKQKSKTKSLPSLKDYRDICDLDLFPQWPEVKKKRRKKKHDIGWNEFLLMRNKNLDLSNRREKNRTSNRALGTLAVGYGVRSGPGEQVQPILSSVPREKKHKKRVAFNLSPVLLEPKPLHDPLVVRDVFQTQCSGTENKTFNTAFPADGRHSKPTTEENSVGSQSTSDDINSQDLFITQRSFSDPYTDLCCSTSPEEALEPRGYTETRPELQSYPASPAKKRLSSERQSLPRKPSRPAYHPKLPRKPSHRHNLDASTQTENFFTSPPLLATSLRFHHRSTCTEEPLDLSLPKRSRLHQWEVISKASEDQCRSEPSVTDLTQSDDSDSHLKSKADLSQLKVVQTRLNESFFFKLKGEGDSPKPRSPLMKFFGSIEKKKP